MHDKSGMRTGRIRLVWIFLFSLILVFSIFVDPDKIHFITCPFKQITGLGCLTCGLSHSFYAAAHFRMGEAFRGHLMGPILMGLVFVFFVKFVIEEATNGEIRIPIKPVMIKTVLVLLSGMWIGFWIMRCLNGLSHS